MENEERVKKIEEAILLMKDQVIRHEDRIDQHDKKLSDFYKAMEVSREDFNFKLNALINAQMRNETGIEKLREASESQLKRIENLENK